MEKFLGHMLNHRYEIREIIGTGGMSVVYKAFDTLLARDVAVKILKEEYRLNEEFRHRFIMESKAITLLTHANIVDIYDVAEDGDVLFIAMEYLDGVTLDEYLDSVGCLGWREGAHYIKQILSAVQHAHERGVVHRDLKPQNIMLMRDGTVKVMDFGIARVPDSETHTLNEQTIGSVHYISPEQASGDALDERTDIYAIGIMLYQFVTGSLPFDGDSAVSVALMQIQEQPALPRDLNAEIPVGLEQIILKAIMKNPSDRYAEASDMLADVERIEGNPSYVFSYDEYMMVDPPQEEAPPPEEEPEEEEEPAPLSKKEKRKLSTKLEIAAGFLTAFVFFILIAGFMVVWPDIFAEEQYEVPNLIDKMYDEVVKDPEYEHFNIVKKDEKPSEKKKGTILSQNIGQFTMVKDGTTIEVSVSSGVQTIPVPDVIGKSEAEAKLIFDNNSIPFRCVYIYSDSVPEGYVIRTSIAAGDEVNLSTDSVTIYVSRGPEENSVRVPDLYGKTQAQAQSALSAVGLRLSETVYEEYSDTIEKGYVMRQTPAYGQEVSKGTTVTIYVSKGPDPSKEEDKTASLSVTVNFDQTYREQTMTILIRQDDTVLNAQSVSYESLKNGVFSWSGTADVGSTVTVSVNDIVRHTMAISTGLNSANISMTDGGYVEPPKEAQLSVSLSFDESYTNQTMTVEIILDGTVLDTQAVSYDQLEKGLFTWSGTVSVGSTVSVSVDGVVQQEIVIKEGQNEIASSLSGGSYQPEPTVPDQSGEPEQQPVTPPEAVA